MDRLTKEQRHRNMAAIHGRDTKPEMIVRKFLFSRGFRYRLNHPRLPGHPDLVLRKYRTVIFVNGCFWHGHDNCKYFRLPKTNIDFWSNKIGRNKERDKKEQCQLAAMGCFAISILRTEESNHTRRLKKNIAWWQNPLKVMANRMNNCEGDNLNYAKEYRKTE